MYLRPATNLDKDFLRELRRQAYRDVVTEQFGAWDEEEQAAWFEKSLAEATFQIVEHRQTPVGALGIWLSPDALHLAELQVLPVWQGKGIGSEVLGALLQDARSQKKPVRLRVLKLNRARSLYERHGFVLCGATETHYLMEWWP
jgi:GNAT superfamily N-acetyltransferase